MELAIVAPIAYLVVTGARIWQTVLVDLGPWQQVAADTVLAITLFASLLHALLFATGMEQRLLLLTYAVATLQLVALGGTLATLQLGTLTAGLVFVALLVGRR